MIGKPAGELEYLDRGIFYGATYRIGSFGTHLYCGHDE